MGQKSIVNWEVENVLGVFELTDGTIMIFVRNGSSKLREVHADALGNIITQKKIILDSSAGISIYAVCSSNLVDFYFTGRVHDQSANYDLTIIFSLSENGVNWALTYDPGRQSAAYNISCDTNGDLIVGGYISSRRSLSSKQFYVHEN